MVSRNVYVFFDDDDDSFNFQTSEEASDWVVEKDSSNRWAGGGRTLLTGSSGEFTFTFNGTDVEIMGDVPLSAESQTVLVQLDGEAPRELFLQDSSQFRNGSYRRWLHLRDLDDGTHTLHLSRLPLGLSVDFAVVAPGLDHVVQGRQLMVDDLNSDLRFQGNWSTVQPVVGRDSEAERLPLPCGLSSHQTATEGSTAMLSFFGSSVSVVGHNSLTAPIVVNFTIDDGVPERVTLGPHISDGISTQFPWFTRGDLGASSHLLKIELIETRDQPFSIDYILYKSEFQRPRMKPRTKSSVPMAVAAGTLGGIIGFTLLIVLIICLCKRSSTVIALRKRTLRSNGKLPIDLDLELSRGNGGPRLGKAGPNAFAWVPTASRSRPTLKPEPFIIPLSEWTPPPSATSTRDRKHPVPLDNIHDRRPSQTAREIGELYRVVHMLTLETERLRQSHSSNASPVDREVEPPPYQETSSLDEDLSPARSPLVQGTLHGSRTLTPSPITSTGPPLPRSLPHPAP
ncbi:hypothetical protein CC1G_01536 [Coprinopsis cinerea okayama7|uniref:Uncharacterized protein n=1 Tax=Coprinopsis cinerea (strain Okayama-7 / 130 / ATCC MYA-4618 / FGSC 9003) TaxID=240176 RepID=A8NHY5_COPC7|nr:hypothetical protein CC1G_01536 [Coprinopsis cinerea okayama7\|eukprot:XP_001833859.2 hypothetical protein CC1G_01536 [Coprinopsis cinerea okayama7\